MFIQEAYFVRKYSRCVLKTREDRKLMLIQTSLPSVLACAALTVTYAPRTYPVISCFASIYFAFAINGFCNIITRSYFGGLSKTSEFLIENGSSLKYQAVPFTCCVPCMPKHEPTRERLLMLKYGVVQVVFIGTFCTFMNLMVRFDNSACYNTSFGKFVQIVSMILTISDLLSTMTAMWSLSIIAAAIIPFMEEKQLKQKFTMFKLMLVFFRIQPQIFNLFTSQLASLRPAQPHYSPVSFTNTLNASFQVAEFFLLAIALRFIYRKSFLTQGYEVNGRN